MDDLELAFVDVETTGTSPAYDRVIEVAVIRVSKGAIVEEYSTLVDPERTISYHIERLTGITNRDVLGAPVFGAVKDEILRMLDGCVLVAHNARFDYGFLKNEFEREHCTFSAPLLCTARLSRTLFPDHRKHNLDSIIERFGLGCARRHRAADDARVLWDFLQALKTTVEEEKLENAVARVMKNPVLPSLLSEAVVMGLPESRGVYVFYGQAGEPLYVGKSTNIRNGVLAHFTGDRHGVRETALCGRVADVRPVGAAGELGTLLQELGLVRELSPLFNRRPAASKKTWVVRRTVDSAGYFCALAGPTEALSADDVPDLLGLFKSKGQAQRAIRSAARDQALCPRKLGLEKGEGACSHVRLGTCRGACTGSEPPAAYNARFLQAFAGTMVEKWPYSGPVAIEERAGGEGEVIVIDRWCLAAWFRYDECGVKRVREERPTFDYDRYRILAAYMRTQRTGRFRPITPDELDRLIDEPESLLAPCVD